MQFTDIELWCNLLILKYSAVYWYKNKMQFNDIKI